LDQYEDHTAVMMLWNREIMYWNRVRGSSLNAGHLISLRPKKIQIVSTVEISSITRFRALNLSCRLRNTLLAAKATGGTAVIMVDGDKIRTLIKEHASMETPKGGYGE